MLPDAVHGRTGQILDEADDVHLIPDTLPCRQVDPAAVGRATLVVTCHDTSVPGSSIEGAGDPDSSAALPNPRQLALAPMSHVVDGLPRPLHPMP
jgi:hypothetical protein